MLLALSFSHAVTGIVQPSCKKTQMVGKKFLSHACRAVHSVAGHFIESTWHHFFLHLHTSVGTKEEFGMSSAKNDVASSYEESVGVAITEGTKLVNCATIL